MEELQHKVNDPGAKLAAMNFYRAVLFGVACLMSVSAIAQWQWIDKDGHKVFSDRAPPADTPEKNILRQPAAAAHVTSLPSATMVPAVNSNPSAPKVEGVAPKLSGKDKELEEKKKQAEDATAAKKKADDEKVAKAKADNCARARQSKVGLDSGVRIARTNDKGEREIMDDTARAAETQRVQSIINSDCN
ncbi:MAG: DUF4124 domain-containing protein [Rhodoferax sp.]